MIAEKMESTDNHTINSALILPKRQFVGMTGFEPATTRPPAVYANRTAPHPENGLQKYKF